MTIVKPSLSVTFKLGEVADLDFSGVFTEKVEVEGCGFSGYTITADSSNVVTYPVPGSIACGSNIEYCTKARIDTSKAGTYTFNINAKIRSQPVGSSNGQHVTKSIPVTVTILPCGNEEISSTGVVEIINLQ